MTSTELIRIAVAGHELEKWLAENVGHTADWPVAITADCQDHADKLCELINELQKALNPYRNEHGLELQATA
jgi:hypothetical protein